MDNIIRIVTSKLLQYLVSIGGGVLLAFETAIPFFVPCFIITALDVWSAFSLGRRVHKKHPERSDGKFKSEYKFRIMYTMFVIFILIITANYVDVHVIKNSDIAVRSTLGGFFLYQIWSILENWSSENENKVARVLQNIMINKAERHFNIDLSELKKKENENK